MKKVILSFQKMRPLKSASTEPIRSQYK